MNTPNPLAYLAARFLLCIFPTAGLMRYVERVDKWRAAGMPETMSDKEIVDRLAYYFARRESKAATVSLLMRLFGRKWLEVYEVLRERDW